MVSLQEEKQVITTKGKEILCTLARNNTANLAPCTHEEADTRMILHAADAVQEGHRKIALRTVDTDVLVLAIALAGRLQEQQVELWVVMGTGSHLRYIAAHEISNCLGSEMSKSLPVFHTFTGCDTVSRFAGRGKKTAFTVWKSYPAVTDAFLQLATTPTPLVSEACMTYLNGSSFSCTTEQATRQMSMKPGSSCLHKKAERMMQFHQLGRPCYSIHTVGAKHVHQTLIYLRQAIGRVCYRGSHIP